MRFTAGTAAVFAISLTAAADAGDGTTTWTDWRWDATPRRTDTGNCATIGAGARLPDLLRLTLSGWRTPTPVTNPYNGSVESNPDERHLFRLDLVIDGLVNPPGRLGDGEVVPYDPFEYGPSPVYGFVELDLDHNRDTGGELSSAARTRYLANVARFGMLPAWPLADRALVWGTQREAPFGQSPNYRASGTDFVLSLCGCFSAAIVSEGGNGNHRFDAGETWVVSGSFLQRAGGYRDASYCSGSPSGVPGLYDPIINLRFSHNQDVNQTTISLVYALDQVGAGMLAGEEPEPVNYEVSDQTSIREAMQDVIDAAEHMQLSGPVYELAHRWAGVDVQEVLDPTAWRATALLGTASSTAVDSPYIWTDTGFNEAIGDVNGDNLTNATDRAIVRQQIILLDAGPLDAEGPFWDNGQVAIIGFGSNFTLYDVTGDGLINDLDLNWYCTPDFDGDGRLSVNDFGSFLNAFISNQPRADLNHSGAFEIGDVVAFSNAFAAGCP